MRSLPWGPLNRWLEPLMMVVVLGGIVRAFFYFRTYSHFPQPFFYEPFDVWMDWFNTAYWAYSPGAYDSWGTVYPPLSFAFLRIFSLNRCYVEASGYTARECDWVGLAALHGFFLLNLVLLWLTFRKVDRKTALWRAVGLGLSLPCLYGLERGNLVVVTFTFFVIGVGPLLSSARLRWLALALAVNFKVYLIAVLFPHLLKRRWIWFEGAFISVILVYLASYAYFGHGSILETYSNISNSANIYQAITFLDIWYNVTFKPLMSLVTGQSWIVYQQFGSRFVDAVYMILSTVHIGAMISIGLAAIAAWLRPEVVPMSRLTLLALMMASLAAEPGGYTSSFFIFLVFLEPWRGLARAWSIFACYILCVPLDISVGEVAPMIQESYLAGHQTFFRYYVTVGPFVRPLLVLSIVYCMALLTIRDVWADIRLQGWSSRWRYRRDAPLLPGVLRPKSKPLHNGP